MHDARHLGHVHLRVRDLERAVGFYRTVLGLRVEERHAGYAFLTFGGHHHDLALQGSGEGVTAPGDGVGLYHSAWEMPDARGLRETYERLRELDVAVDPVDHGISKALYFDDPDDNGVEVYLDVRDARDVEEWRGRNEWFDPTAL
ncbi:biphenyl-2,3-diol 1,2-dioxygenase [Haloglomus irregulare]|jgi:catechol 2,3-dioxygenase|uniref:Biphenyl-2,3-diol 1,2-dioxygenase n=1 Tax=Haloglomus irregulare TaxID=2234134 RepID=A0A554NCT8_9EURY|nr:VOC family protein [Haloglomus irregulare]TSD15192.1 biphenyl-2,3-diol 1,2-dioxygenase [Haloglomus irregulare]